MARASAPQGPQRAVARGAGLPLPSARRDAALLRVGWPLWESLLDQVRGSGQPMEVWSLTSGSLQSRARSPASLALIAAPLTDTDLCALRSAELEPSLLRRPADPAAGMLAGSDVARKEWIRLVVLTPEGPCLLVQLRPVPMGAGGTMPSSVQAHGLLRVGDDADATELLFADAPMADSLGWQVGQTLVPSDWRAAGLQPFDVLLLLASARERQPFNLVLFTSPFAGPVEASECHWRLIPEASRVAGLGTAPAASTRCAQLQISAWTREAPDGEQLRRIQALALRATVNGVVVTDNRLPGNPIVDVNPGFERLTGYSAAEVLGRTCNFLQGTLTNQPGRRQISEALAREEAVSVVLRNFRKDGTPFWNRIEISPVVEEQTREVTHFVALQTDVTLQYQRDLVARQRSAELEQMFRNCPLGVVVHDAQGLVRMINPAFESLTGLVAEDHETQSLECLVQTLARECKPDARRPRWPAAGQTLQWVLDRPRRLVLEVSAVDIGALGSDLDIERMVFFRNATAEHELRTMKTEFLATTAHEMRAPLASVRGFAELLLIRQVPQAQAREMIEIVFRQAMRLNNLLGDLLELSKIEAQGPGGLSLSSIDPLPLARRIVQGLILPGDVREVHVQASDPAVQLLGHPQKLEQVLLNLLTNALKYSPGGQAVSVQIDPVTDADGLDWCHISISDQGLGLSEEHLGRLFTRFFRANPNSEIQGTGLGLVIVKELVERMGGRIEVSSVLGQGSTFRVCLQRPGMVATAIPDLVELG